MRADVAAADFADGKGFDACQGRYVRSDLRSVRFALPDVAIADDDDGRFFGAAVLVAVGAQNFLFLYFVINFFAVKQVVEVSGAIDNGVA